MRTILSRLFVMLLFIAYFALLLGLLWWTLASYFKSQYQKWIRHRKSGGAVGAASAHHYQGSRPAK